MKQNQQFRGIGLVLLVIALITFASSLTSQGSLFSQEMTHQEFMVAVENKTIESVDINQNQQPPTGTLDILLKSGDRAVVAVSDVKEAEKLLQENSIDYVVENVPQENYLMSVIIPVALSAVVIMFMFMFMNARLGGGGGGILPSILGMGVALAGGGLRKAMGGKGGRKGGGDGRGEASPDGAKPGAGRGLAGLLSGLGRGDGKPQGTNGGGKHAKPLEGNPTGGEPQNTGDQPQGANRKGSDGKPQGTNGNGTGSPVPPAPDGAPPDPSGGNRPQGTNDAGGFAREGAPDGADRSTTRKGKTF